jgi:hypothetical protein
MPSSVTSFLFKNDLECESSDAVFVSGKGRRAAIILEKPINLLGSFQPDSWRALDKNPLAP